ncbi:MAG TPA: hypothetical protein IAC31_02285 [Candidatus Faecousia intestinigallinarum]|nr:hypothetical protein [Candidatus Faecousia intestinigallinarum]
MSNLTKHKHTRRGLRIALTALVIALLAVPASASSLESSPIVAGTTALLQDIATVAAAMSIATGGVCAIVFAIRKQMADEQDGKLWSKRIANAIIWGVAGGLLSGVISLVASYYK